MNVNYKKIKPHKNIKFDKESLFNSLYKNDKDYLTLVAFINRMEKDDNLTLNDFVNQSKEKFLFL